MASYRLTFTYKNTEYNEPLDKVKLAQIGCELDEELDVDSKKTIADIYNKIILPMIGNPIGGINITRYQSEKLESFGFEGNILLFTHETRDEAKLINPILNSAGEV
ncbi:hypothetical protein [Moritella viscosa]|uniref:Enoyl-[acyl-carrier-protein] reductase [NADH] FabI-NADH-dependent enoyl-ACP reductase n=1 Tax=Moritella viscosa TaxID=80854 RepID=A0ABY1HBZ9_9GAMM|nr:hypothetical protein [Moritella viscosa]SGY84234.1 Enoyl-[acyl-carrier-protein] reductase [NADH] FabI-NADH-dependent enoyl-ACP reductase [Moritella viscosa]SGY86203.1 Enoyl-[acyl-carrier-protein] reductase [NADH] FabI-NADH-dependent enoyl-ACP reductase [Moritella viscosa]SHO24554.1 Enoyl-[acyl-carrier-protein] reductase [NADH] FabI-NADH-dependent enoyl-ACP reductase [Moritella viscosa]